ncbi:glucose-1-phosphate thymidylyltransferase RfbA [uncultured Rossellomorea sp.]|uniref:glucose-1-phosphate thymidylyltransferase RfbA n=1 Tax=uncultured Rossellomorea sp. TaxID=2837549 RepID=UPI0026084A1F|nr:glucose-1-phosphate thymidylyltransferase RfbA [uncultured Rossellomorea sp.]
MKGIIMAGGRGTRLSPLTKSISKALLPIYDKPMIYYPLSTLMLAGVREILVITTSQDQDRFMKMLGDGSHLGLHIQYKVEKEPKGIANAFLIGEEFIGNDHVMLILGDNIFYGEHLPERLQNALHSKIGATLFCFQVDEPQRYGIVELDQNNRAITIEEKPALPKSNYALTGLYVYDQRAVEVAKKIQPSVRGELEITDINNVYLDMGEVSVEILGESFAWFDAGTHPSILEAAQFIETIERYLGGKIGCIEEIAFREGFISKDQFTKLANENGKSDYGRYLKNLVSRL